MISHAGLGSTAFGRLRCLKLLIDAGRVTVGGNHNLKIFGTLQCASGKRMKPQNRVFFRDEQEATEAGYRPCGHCMRVAYQKWKALN